jgi:hypothetical protein
MKGDDYGRTDSVHRLTDTREAEPTRQLPRRRPLIKQADVGEVFDDMQRRGLIEDPESPWSFPVVPSRRTGTYTFAWTTGKWTSQRKTPVASDWWHPEHASRIEMVLSGPEEQTRRWICIRTARRRPHSRWFKGCGSSQSCPLVTATFQRRF